MGYKSMVCPRCGSRMQRLYIKKNKQLRGFGWLCWSCSTPDKAYTLIDQDYRPHVSRWAETVFWVPSVEGYREVVKRTVYVRAGNGWKARGWLLLPYEEVVLDYMLPAGERAVREGLSGVIVKRAAASTFSITCPCGTELVFDVLREKAYICMPGKKPKKVFAKPRAFIVECPRCMTRNEYAVDHMNPRVEIVCRRCKLKGILDVSARKAYWEPWKSGGAVNGVTQLRVEMS